MTNLNKVSTSVEKLSQKKEWKVLYVDARSFCKVHTPRPTETWRDLIDKFKKRNQAEKERLVLVTQKHNLIVQHNNLSKQLEKLEAQPVSSPEEYKSKMRKMQSIRDAMKELAKKIEEKQKEIDKKEEEIENFNKEILVLADKVREEEHNENKKNQEKLENLKQFQIDDLKEQLFAA